MDAIVSSFLVWMAGSAGVALVAAVAAWGLKKLYAKRPAARDLVEGTIITAVKLAEKEIPDNTPSPGLARLDWALKYVLKVWEAMAARRATTAEEANIKEAIQTTHAELESGGLLTAAKGLLIVMGLAAMLAVGGCVSPATQQWADRGLQAVDNAKANDQAMANLARKLLDDRLKSDVMRIQEDILKAQSGTLKDENGKPIPIDQAWVDAHGKTILLLIDQHAKDLKVIDAGLAESQKNLDEGPRKSIEKMLALRWSMGQQGTTEAQLAQLTQAVSGLIARQSATPPK